MGAPGFDDAPLARVKHGQPKPLQFVYPYYENPRFLTRQLDTWTRYQDDLKLLISAIVVDDGSPVAPAELVLAGRSHPFPIRLFRIDVDVRWNWLAARNVAMYHARDGWCLLTDMDHVIDAELARSLATGAHDPGIIYKLNRREHTGKPIHPHPNTMLMMRAMFWRAGGYDETLSGYYGSDGDWRRRCVVTAPVRILPDVITRYEYVDDSSTMTYKRKQPEDAEVKRRVARRQRGWKPKTLSFPYHEVTL